MWQAAQVGREAIRRRPISHYKFDALELVRTIDQRYRWYNLTYDTSSFHFHNFKLKIITGWQCRAPKALSTTCGTVALPVALPVALASAGFYPYCTGN